MVEILVAFGLNTVFDRNKIRYRSIVRTLTHAIRKYITPYKKIAIYIKSVIYMVNQRYVYGTIFYTPEFSFCRK